MSKNFKHVVSYLSLKLKQICQALALGSSDLHSLLENYRPESSDFSKSRLLTLFQLLVQADGDNEQWHKKTFIITR
jgi:hypothetical protein